MRFATHDGPGIRTTVFFKGCPLACTWCHNPESQSFLPDILFFEDRCRHCGECESVCPEHSPHDRRHCRRCGRCVETCVAEARRMAGETYTLDRLLAELERDQVFYGESGGGITLSGGEPMSRPRFVAALLRACRRRGIATAIETCGFAYPEVFLQTALLADLVLFDLKSADPEAHLRHTGVSLRIIRANLEALARTRHPLKVRIPVVPGINDSDADIRDFASLLAPLAVPVELLPYHAIGAAKYRRLNRPYPLQDTPEPAPAEMARYAAGLETAGLHVELGGNP